MPKKKKCWKCDTEMDWISYKAYWSCPYCYSRSYEEEQCLRRKMNLKEWLKYIILPILAAALIGIGGSILLVKVVFAEENTLYTVQPGDTLGQIAMRVYGSEGKWRDIWNNNPQIKDPNLIYPGQKITISGQVIIKEDKPHPTKDEFKDKAIKLMFKVCETKFISYGDLNREILSLQRVINESMPREIPRRTRTVLRDLDKALVIKEIYILADAIADVYEKDKDDACLLLAIAWQETQFYNRRGKAGEVGFYQFLPSTVKSLHRGNYEIVLSSLEDDPHFATTYTRWYVYCLKKEYGSLEKALYRYNGHWSYAGNVLYKVSKIRREVGL